MRKSTAILGTLSVACAASAAWCWWQLRAEREYVATLETRQLESLDEMLAANLAPVEAALRLQEQNVGR